MKIFKISRASIAITIITILMLAFAYDRYYELVKRDYNLSVACSSANGFIYRNAKGQNECVHSTPKK